MKVKKILSSRPILAYPDWNNIEDNPFKVYADASIQGFGVVLTQTQTNESGRQQEKNNFI